MVPSDFFDFFVLYSNQDLDKLEVSNRLHSVTFKNHNFTLLYVYFVDKVVSSHYNLKPRLPVGENIIMLQY